MPLTQQQMQRLIAEAKQSNRTASLPVFDAKGLELPSKDEMDNERSKKFLGKDADGASKSFMVNYDYKDEMGKDQTRKVVIKIFHDNAESAQRYRDECNSSVLTVAAIGEHYIPVEGCVELPPSAEDKKKEGSETLRMIVFSEPMQCSLTQMIKTTEKRAESDKKPQILDNLYKYRMIYDLANCLVGFCSSEPKYKSMLVDINPGNVMLPFDFEERMGLVNKSERLGSLRNLSSINDLAKLASIFHLGSSNYNLQGAQASKAHYGHAICDNVNFGLNVDRASEFFTEKQIVFQFACVAYQILTNTTFDAYTEADVIRILNKVPPDDNKAYRDRYFKEYRKQEFLLLEILSKCMDKGKDGKISMDCVLKNLEKLLILELTKDPTIKPEVKDKLKKELVDKHGVSVETVFDFQEKFPQKELMSPKPVEDTKEGTAGILGALNIDKKDVQQNASANNKNASVPPAHQDQLATTPVEEAPKQTRRSP